MTTFERIACGALAGLAGTVAIQFAETALHKTAPSAVPKMKGDPGQYMVQTADQALPEPVRQRVPNTVENVAAGSLGYFYGATFGALYGLVRPRNKSVMIDGTILGAACWAAGYLGWLPASKLMNPIWKQKPAEIAGPIATHAIYGLATVGASEIIDHVLAD